MRLFICILLALLSLGLCILCLGTLLVSCSGHPPITAMGMWIMPLSLLGGTVFLYLSLFFWKTRRSRAPGSLKKEATWMPRKILIFLASFLVATIAFFLLSILMVWLAVNTTLPHWTAYVFHALFIVMAVCAGLFIYRRLARIGA
jgi:hypothetical protein